MATFGSVLSVLSLIPKGRPFDFYDRMVTSLEVRLREPAASQSPDYPAVTWEAALSDLELLVGRDVRPLLNEPALREIEEQVRHRLEEIRQDGPFPLAYSADISLAQCCYVMCRLLAPETVLETGVAYGTSSAFILRALQENGRGALHSVDVVWSTDRDAHRFIGALVPEEMRGRWHLHLGASRRILPGLLQKLQRVDLFVHDSLHTYWNMRREFQTVWPHLSPGGVILSDDVHRNEAFGELREFDTRFWRVVQEQRKDYASFGIAVKGPEGVMG